MECSELTLNEAIKKVDCFCPVKIIFNGIVLYNDYDDENNYEEAAPFIVIPDRIWQFDKYIVKSINIDIVEFHHAVISMQGEYRSKVVL